MTAWAMLLASSSLAVGTAWQLISSPKLGGGGLVVNDGVTAVVGDSPYDVLVSSVIAVVSLTDTRASVSVPITTISVAVSTQPINIEVTTP